MKMLRLFEIDRILESKERFLDTRKSRELGQFNETTIESKRIGYITDFPFLDSNLEDSYEVHQ